MCARHGQWDLARRIFEGMVAEDVPADALTFNALLMACVKGGSLEVRHARPMCTHLPVCVRACLYDNNAGVRLYLRTFTYIGIC